MPVNAGIAASKQNVTRSDHSLSDVRVIAAALSPAAHAARKDGQQEKRRDLSAAAAQLSTGTNKPSQSVMRGLGNHRLRSKTF